MPNLQKNSSFETSEILIGALLRVPAEAIHRRIIRELKEARLTELSMPG
jgi:hypothetical protein